MKKFLLLLTQLLLAIRYRITYKGFDEIKALLKDSKQGCLFLPNHPAVVVDPLIVSVPLVRSFAVRPLIIEYMYYHPAFHWIVRKLNALAIPNFGTSFSPLKLKRAERALQTISQGLKNGDRFLIYPAGTTKFQAKEVVGGAFGVHQLVGENPDVPVVLVRITGLWGSSFSRAATAGTTPDSKKVLQNGLWTVLKNLLFFVPKRPITVEFELAPYDFPRSASKQEFNRYLENWYNKPFGPNGEPILLVSYAFWKDQFLEIPEVKAVSVDISTVPDEIKKQVIAKIAQLAKIPEAQVTPDLKLIENLGLDSLDHAELVVFLETEYGISGVAPESLTTVASLFLVAKDGQKNEDNQKKEKQEESKKKASLSTRRSHSRVEIADATNLPEAFFKACDKGLFQLACADMSYYRCKKIVLLLSEKIANLKGERIGILLPASNVTYLLVLACQMAGKVPVMVNWTVGGKHLDTVLEVSKIEVVLSSWAFLDALDAVDISCLEPLLLMLEELKAEISLLDLMRVSCTALMKVSVPKVAEEAVVLFTSGTESMPKGVPLTHKNILFDLKAAMNRVALYEDDTLLAMLPPFHSFGFTVTGLLPLIARIPVVFYPNPTDSKTLANAIERWGVTVLCSAPTFLRNIFQFAKSVDTSTVRMVISGAEKAPDELFQSMPKNALFVEG
ncbi:MAG: AMP-binding protein, partial [Verrucomicrobia bacterium]|nr:AMP-binding protein [Verrucomicrobiota bacterium]